MKRIKLRTGEAARVSDQDYDYLNQWSWYGKKQHGKVHAYRKTMIGEKLVGLRMQRVITNAHEGEKVVFNDANPLNCTHKNMRVVTLNTRRSRKNNIHSATNYRGVTRSRGKFRARLYLNGEHIELGTFTKSVEAARAYDRAVSKLLGNRALTNF